MERCTLSSKQLNVVVIIELGIPGAYDPKRDPKIPLEVWIAPSLWRDLGGGRRPRRLLNYQCRVDNNLEGNGVSVQPARQN